MNANELADELSSNDIRDYHLYEYLPEIISMLRQLQAENEALKEQLYPTPKEFIGVSKDGLPMFKEERNDAGFYMSDAEHYKLKCASQQAEIEALKADKDRITRDLIGASFYEHDYKTLLPKYEALKKQNGQLEFMVGYLEQEVFELKGS